MSARRVHGDIEGDRGNLRERVFTIVRAIPVGRVMTYGQISTLLASRISPLAVGWMLHRCPDDVPWHRVVNASGGCSTDRLPDVPPGLQRALLEAEGALLTLAGRVDLATCRWWPPAPPWTDE
jgi:methylated-DNA-protein-cysteine methyltransferase-like protein